MVTWSTQTGKLLGVPRWNEIYAQEELWPREVTSLNSFIHSHSVHSKAVMGQGGGMTSINREKGHCLGM